jgi:SAM-dependent methyltransferase
MIPVGIRRLLKNLMGIGQIERALEEHHRAYQRHIEIVHGRYQREFAAVCAGLNRSDVFRLETKTERDTSATAHGNGIQVKITPHADYPHTYFRMETAAGVFNEPLGYSHLGLAKLVTEYEFSNVLEIGSRCGTAARAFEFLGKKVYSVEILEAYEASVCGDYLDARFPEPFDAIWCSHVLEHQRHLGRFCEKMFDDLRPGGVLALTVPTSLSPLLIGHCNIFTPLHLIYHLILAGFDCSAAKLKCYDWQMTLLVRKVPNGLERISFATTHHPSHIPGKREMGSEPRLFDYLPKEIAAKITPAGHVWGEVDSINWE